MKIVILMLFVAIHVKLPRECQQTLYAQESFVKRKSRNFMHQSHKTANLQYLFLCPVICDIGRIK